ncbi:ABC transporter substrate-binding protein [Calorimonas adulescens]|uniref:ABC transporter substrate-binding protein n=1 Tax=Calorimonas adulescens TaxID=2606906 RepID=A0A5D8QFB9_9THEO|nr:ABC transporter substrate-binding protein [Calorimonas adulescens]TZE82889.1 ABC transporter substrate-binding protein [Calorimonas adulescens]
MDRTVGKFLAVFLLIFTLAGCTATADTAAGKEKFRIGILQWVEHPDFENSKLGFIEGLKESNLDESTVDVEVLNAQGDAGTARQIASKFVDEKKDLILAIGTTSTQAVYNLTKEIPIVFAAVTDPVRAGVVKGLKETGTNVTGVSNFTPPDEIFGLIEELFPEAINIGVIYNPGEINSSVQVEKAKEICKKDGLNLVVAPVSSSGEVPQAAQSLVGRIDVLYVPTDSTVVSSMEAVVKVANSNKIPTVGSGKGQVDGGVLVARGVDYFDMGVEAGKMAADILTKGKKPSEIPVLMPHDLTLAVNEDTADILGIKIPDTLR